MKSFDSYRKSLWEASRPIRNWLRQWNPMYRAPRERNRCPACGSRKTRHLDTLSLVGFSNRKVGFVSGCRDCGIAFANPMPRPDELERLYAPHGKFHAEREGTAQERARSSGITDSKLRLLFEPVASSLDVLQPPRDAKVLDFGCGDGGFLNSLRELGWKTYGIEPSTKVAFPRHHELEEPPEEPTFDLVIMHHVLEHLDEPLATLRAIAKATNPGGILYISVPGLDSLPEHGDRDYCIRCSGHIVAYTEDCLRALLARAGFQSVVGLNQDRFDERLTQGRPIRTRILGRRSAERLEPPSRPLRAARLAFAAYRRQHARDLPWIERIAPVRLQASLQNARRHRRARQKRRQRRNRGEATTG